MSRILATVSKATTRHLCTNQCGQMAQLSFQYWAINNNENLSNIIKFCPIRVNILPNIK